MKKSYYIVRLNQKNGWIDYLGRVKDEDSGRTLAWDNRQHFEEAVRFKTAASARRQAKRSAIVRYMLDNPREWGKVAIEIIKITEELVESSADTPLLALARCAK